MRTCMGHFRKDYTQISKNKLSLTRTWSVNNNMCSQKVHRRLEMPKNLWYYEWPPLGDYDIFAGQ